MKKTYSLLCIAFAAVLSVPYLFGGIIFGFYNDYNVKTANVESGGVYPVIENLRLNSNGVEKIDAEIYQSNSFLRVNKSNSFLFTVKNDGGSDIKYSLEIQIAWTEESAEAGILLVYPYQTADDTIYRNLSGGDFSGAVIGYGASDQKEVILSTGVRQGISETIDSEFLVTDNAKDGVFSKAYAYKLFFYENPDVALNPEIYHNKNIEVNLAVNAVLSGKQTGWTGTTKASFGVTSVIDTAFPVIEEIPIPKTYFITQAQDIDLASYAVAEDRFDGDITGKIAINSSPSFDPQKSGVYNITYSVTNSLGNPAAPLHITVVVWDFAKITSGYYHTLALTTHGKVYVWGYNYYGQLGDGTNTDRSVPVQLDSLNNIIDVAAGVGCSYALAADGQVYSWGRNENGRLGDGTTTAKNKPVKVSQPNGLKFVQISARYATAGGVTAEGDVYTWGYGGYGAAGTNKTGDIHAPAKIDISNVAQLELGYYNGAAVTKDGNIYTWGSNTYGALGTGAASSAGPNPIVRIPYFGDNGIAMKQVSAGYYHMAAVSRDGRVFTWGYGADGRLGNGATSNKFTPQEIEFPSAGQKALAGYFHTGVLTSGGTAYFFGQNYYGKLGNGNTANQSSPVKIQSVDNATDFSIAYDSSFVLSGGINVFGMGYGGTGVLGTGNNNNSNIPVKWAFIPPQPIRR